MVGSRGPRPRGATTRAAAEEQRSHGSVWTRRRCACGVQVGWGACDSTVCVRAASIARVRAANDVLASSTRVDRDVRAMSMRMSVTVAVRRGRGSTSRSGGLLLDTRPHTTHHNPNAKHKNRLESRLVSPARESYFHINSHTQPAIFESTNMTFEEGVCMGFLALHYHTGLAGAHGRGRGHVCLVAATARPRWALHLQCTLRTRVHGTSTPSLTAQAHLTGDLDHQIAHTNSSQHGHRNTNTRPHMPTPEP